MRITADKKTLFCLGERRHCFDFSSKGYVNLSLAQSPSGDSKQAVLSRSEFLNKGYYFPITDRLGEILKRHKKDGFLVDAGCGEGYYTAHLSSLGYLVAGFDLSKYAVASTASRMRCKTSPEAFCAVSSVFELPLKSESADAVVSIFAPCAEAEFSRILKNDGIFVVVSAGKDHLMGLKRAIYDTAYENDERADMPKSMSLIEHEELKYTVTVEGEKDIFNLFSMTPYYWRTSQSDSEKLRHLDSLTTEIDISFSVYSKNTAKGDSNDNR